MTQPNVVKLWLELIGNEKRAQVLLDRVWILNGVSHRGDCRGQVKGRVCQSCGKKLTAREMWQDKPKPCPSKALFGERMSQLLYSMRKYQPALDAWDIGRVEPRDVQAWCEWILDGKYEGPVWMPSVS